MLSEDGQLDYSDVSSGWQYDQSIIVTDGHITIHAANHSLSHATINNKTAGKTSLFSSTMKSSSSIKQWLHSAFCITLTAVTGEG